MLFIVDCERAETVVHRVDLHTGTYLMPKRVRGTVIEQINDLIWMMDRDDCNRIIFDKMHVGYAFHSHFMNTVRNLDTITVDDIGNVTWHPRHHKNTWEL